MKSLPIRSLTATAAAGLGLLAAAAPAQATYPGTNGVIAFSTSSATNTTGQIFTVNADGSGRKAITGPGAFQDSSPSFSADGERIVYVRTATGMMAPPGSIWIMNADGSGQTELATGSVGDNLTEPTFSPDGQTIAFSRSDGTATNIWSMSSADGSNQQPLTDFTNPQFASSAAYSPDGSKIVVSFRAGGGGSPSRIGIMDATGSAVTQLGPGAAAYDSSPDWSSDGSKIVFQRDFSLFEMNSDGTGTLRLTQSAGPTDVSPVYAPSGPQFAFARQNGTSGEIRLGASGVMNGPTNPVTTTAGSAFPAVSWQALNPPSCKLDKTKAAKSAKKVTFSVTCSNEDAAMTVSGKGKGKGKFTVPPTTVDVPVGSSAVGVPLPKKGAKSLKKGLKAGKKGKLALNITFSDGLGASTDTSTKLKLKPRKK